jgi:hypothetical protein
MIYSIKGKNRKSFLIEVFVYLIQSYYLTVFFCISVRPDFCEEEPIYTNSIRRWLKSLQTPESIGIYFHAQ